MDVELSLSLIPYLIFSKLIFLVSSVSIYGFSTSFPYFSLLKSSTMKKWNTKAISADPKNTAIVYIGPFSKSKITVATNP